MEEEDVLNIRIEMIEEEEPKLEHEVTDERYIAIEIIGREEIVGRNCF